MRADADVEAGATALDAGEWTAARDAFEAALRTGDVARAHDGLGRALWWLGDVDGAIEHRERAYVMVKEAGDPRAAAAIAVWLAREHLAAYANDAVAGGWLARADRLLGDADVPERGWWLLVKARDTADVTERAALADRALRIALRGDEPDLEVAALAEAGLADIEAGRVAEGLDRLDEAMTAATAGEASLLETVAQTCCSLVAACDLAGDAGRLEQWTRIVEGFVSRRGDMPLLGFCRTCNAQMLAATGHRGDAERELIGSVQDLGVGGHRSRCVDPSVKLAEVRILQGRYEEAAALLEGRERLPEAVGPASDLDIARGEPALALARLLRRLNLVGRDGLLAPPLMARLALAQRAHGDGAGSRSTVAEMRASAETSGHPMVAAYAAMARGLLGSDATAEDLSFAADRFDKLGMSLEAARARAALAHEIARSDPAPAVAIAVDAEAALRRAGADREADAVAALIRDLGGPARSGPKDAGVLTARETEVLHLLAEGLTNAEIAARLYISTKTAAHHVSAVLAKLGLRNRAEAAAFALRQSRNDRAPR